MAFFVALGVFGLACTVVFCFACRENDFCTTWVYGRPFTAAGDYCLCNRGEGLEGFAMRPAGLVLDVVFYGLLAWGLTALVRGSFSRSSQGLESE